MVYANPHPTCPASEEEYRSAPILLRWERLASEPSPAALPPCEGVVHDPISVWFLEADHPRPLRSSTSYSPFPRGIIISLPPTDIQSDRLAGLKRNEITSLGGRAIVIDRVCDRYVLIISSAPSHAADGSVRPVREGYKIKMREAPFVRLLGRLHLAIRKTQLRRAVV